MNKHHQDLIVNADGQPVTINQSLYPISGWPRVKFGFQVGVGFAGAIWVVIVISHWLGKLLTWIGI